MCGMARGGGRAQVCSMDPRSATTSLAEYGRVVSAHRGSAQLASILATSSSMERLGGAWAVRYGRAGVSLVASPGTEPGRPLESSGLSAFFPGVRRRAVVRWASAYDAGHVAGREGAHGASARAAQRRRTHGEHRQRSRETGRKEGKHAPSAWRARRLMIGTTLGSGVHEIWQEFAPKPPD